MNLDKAIAEAVIMLRALNDFEEPFMVASFKTGMAFIMARIYGIKVEAIIQMINEATQ